jgi:N utilization substance protein A
MDTSSIPGLELIQVADVVAREKSIEREEVMLAMEEAIQKAGRAKYGLDRDIRVMVRLLLNVGWKWLKRLRTKQRK